MDALADIWPQLTWITVLVVSVLASGHAVLYKRDSRAAIGWVGLIWVAPLVGALLYVFLGINRIKRRAALLRGEMLHRAPGPVAQLVAPGSLEAALMPDRVHLSSLLQLVNTISTRPMVPGNRVTALIDGDAAYPAMLAAIEGARRTISLSTYIFDHDRAGALFRDALRGAVERGVEVRVLIDAVGARYSLPPMEKTLRRAGVPVARFLPTVLPWRLPYLNLRNHRKILIVDGAVGFTGGMNIREGHLLRLAPAHPVADLHFRLDGPIVAQLQEVFAEDWRFTTKEALEGDGWFPPLSPCGHAPARAISDGPDEDFDKLRVALLGAIACARRSIQILTPYFLPDSATITALSIAALRGVRVDVLLPLNNNLALVKWASMAQLWRVLESGVHVHLVGGPFDHSKLMIVDDAWVLIGSANWDARSLRLNFELNVEVYDEGLADELGALVRDKLGRAHELSLAEVDGRSLPVRLRDGVARLFTPYL